MSLKSLLYRNNNQILHKPLAIIIYGRMLVDQKSYNIHDAFCYVILFD
jgi:hypothetical protein